VGTPFVILSSSHISIRGRLNFSFGFGSGAEIGEKFSFGLVSFSVDRAAASFGFGRNYH